jgi:hypothetical protein
MGSGAMIYRPGFVNTDSGIQKLIGGGREGDTHTHRRRGDLISLLSFFSK